MANVMLREAKHDAEQWIEANSRLRNAAPAAGAGLPLFRMRLDTAGYDALTAMLRRCLHSPVVRSVYPANVAGLFCLFAAETLRRRDQGGAWSWEQALQPLGLRTPLDQEERHALVERGLPFWGLPLRRSADGSRMSFSLLLLQAGLPTPLLARDEFQRFMQAALRDIEQFAASGAAAIRLVADAGRRLPSAWQRDETIELAADFLLALVPVRRAMRTGGVPPAEWRQTLPIDLSDIAAQRLLDALLAQPAPARPPLRELDALCRRVLVSRGGAWEQRLAPADAGRLPPSLVSSPPFTGPEPPIRVRLTVGGAEIALLESEQDGGTAWLYRPVAGARPALDFDQPVEARLLVDGQECGRLDLPGGTALGAAPWVFEENAAAGMLMLLGQGSRSTTAPRLFVAVDPATGTFEAAAGEVIVGDALAGSARVLHAVSGSVTWHEHDEDFAVRLRTGEEQPTGASIAIDATRPRWDVQGMMACLGPPRIASPRGGARLLWRRPGATNNWQPFSGKLPLGEIELALVAEDAFSDRQRLAILPQDARIAARQTKTGFEVVVAGFGPALISLPGHPEAQRTTNVDGSLRFKIESGREPPAEVAVLTRLGGSDLRHRVRVRLDTGVLLHPDGQVVAPNTDVSFRDLAALVARGGDADGYAEISASLLTVSSGELPARLPGTRLARSLRFVEEFPMARLLPELRRMYATAGERDASVRLHVRLEGKDGPPINVKAFGATLDFQRGANRVLLNDGHPGVNRADAGLAAFALVRPQAPLARLQRDDGGGWQLPAAPGPWLIVGTGALAMQVRPRLYASAAAVAEGALASAATCSVPDQRSLMFAEVFTAMAAAPDEAAHQQEWAFLDATLEAGMRLAPALFFDALVHAGECPLLLVNWLLRADDAQVARIAALEDGLSFAWALVPMAAWRAGAEQFLARYRALGFNAGPALGARLEAIADCCPPARAGVWEARDAVGLPPGANEFPRAYLPAIRAILADGAGPDPGQDAWQGAVVRCTDWENLPQMVHDGAPHVAACYALSQVVASPRTVSAIRFCRHQAPDRFDQRFRFAHLLAAGG